MRVGVDVGVWVCIANVNIVSVFLNVSVIDELLITSQ